MADVWDVGLLNSMGKCLIECQSGTQLGSVDVGSGGEEFDFLEFND